MRVLKAPQELEGIDALVLWGGEDISPSIYNHKLRPGGFTGPALPSHRDRIEIALVQQASARGIPIIGICRGAQLMCALSGGSLYQHVNNHGGIYHPLKLSIGKQVVSNSVHHQMMNLEGVDHELIGWTEPLSDVYYDQTGKVKGPEKEPEIAWIPRTKALCIQGHPEYIHDDKNPFLQLALDLVDHYVVNKTPEKC